MTGSVAYSWVDYVSLLGPTAVALVAAIIVVAGWVVNSRTALNNEIEKEARQYKIDMCLAIMDYHKYFIEKTRDNGGRLNVDDDSLVDLFEHMTSKILLYGDSEENTLLRKLSSSFRVAADNLGKRNVDEASAHRDISYLTNQLLSLSQQKFRKELRLEKPTKISKALASEVKR
ncbi:hypothetical protein KDA11_05040 [Candidatus Saccharibacteria bacterium]|nr:hypothetical protein [Candidatus Saccharibacteria bacterium]